MRHIPSPSGTNSASSSPLEYLCVCQFWHFTTVYESELQVLCSGLHTRTPPRVRLTRKAHLHIPARSLWGTWQHAERRMQTCKRKKLLAGVASCMPAVHSLVCVCCTSPLAESQKQSPQTGGQSCGQVTASCGIDGARLVTACCQQDLCGTTQSLNNAQHLVPCTRTSLVGLHTPSPHTGGQSLGHVNTLSLRMQ